MKKVRVNKRNVNYLIKNKKNANELVNLKKDTDLIANDYEQITEFNKTSFIELTILVIPIQFKNLESTMCNECLKKIFTGNAPNIQEYFSEVSNKKLIVDAEIVELIKIPYDYEEFIGTENCREGYLKLINIVLDEIRKQDIVVPDNISTWSNNQVIAPMIVHSGNDGGDTCIRKDIASLQYSIGYLRMLNDKLYFDKYVLISEKASIGTFAHEFGHLAFDWPDLYGLNNENNKLSWDGTGNWDLMGLGLFNQNGNLPAHPNAWLKNLAGWVDMYTIQTLSKHKLTIKPVIQALKIYKIISPYYEIGQYLVIENRTYDGFDKSIPGEGLLIWRVDENGSMNSIDKPLIELIQSDGNDHLSNPDDNNEGDKSDAFPGELKVVYLKDTGKPSTSFPKGSLSGVFIYGIKQEKNKSISLTIEIKK